jgi:hypothetical protein
MAPRALLSLILPAFHHMPTGWHRASFGIIASFSVALFHISVALPTASIALRFQNALTYAVKLLLAVV